MMRVLHLVKTAIGATWALQQMSELVKFGVDVHVALPQNGPLLPLYKKAGIIVHFSQTDFPISKPWQIVSHLNKFRSLISKINPDIIHSHFVGTTLTMRRALGKRNGTPRVFQVPGPLHLEHPLFRRSEIFSSGPADYWVGSCEWTRRCYLKCGVQKNRIFLSYYGIDLENFQSFERSRKLQKELGIANGTPLVGMVAYMYPPKRYLGQRRGIKGHEDLIDAINICNKSIPNINCVFIGGAWNNAKRYENRVRDYAAKRLGGQAIFLGIRNDVAELYADLDVVVHSSHSENVGGARESLLMGIPTIATNVGGFPDMVIPGRTGWLVPPKDPKRLSDAILEVLANPVEAKKLALQGQQRVKELMDVKTNASEILEIYKTIIQNNYNLNQ